MKSEDVLFMVVEILIPEVLVGVTGVRFRCHQPLVPLAYNHPERSHSLSQGYVIISASLFPLSSHLTNTRFHINRVPMFYVNNEEIDNELLNEGIEDGIINHAGHVDALN